MIHKDTCPWSPTYSECTCVEEKTNMARLLQFIEEIGADPSRIRVSMFGYAAILKDLHAFSRVSWIEEGAVPMYLTWHRGPGKKELRIEMDTSLEPGGFELDD